MYYRRKVILALISRCGGQIEKLRLQKLLLLFCSLQENAVYSFVPYRYGCFSFQANADLVTMERKGLVESTDSSWILKAIKDEFVNLKPSDLVHMEIICSRYAHLSTDELIRHTYITHPYYALRSTITDKLLNEDQKRTVSQTVSSESSTCLFTIGYEGRTIEDVLNILLKRNIRVLCDVRKNALSMKYGFSKTTLSNACKNVGIAYYHFADLGIESSERKALVTKEDYQELFAEYRSGVVVNTRPRQRELLQLISSENRVALICFEKDSGMCHRSHLADALVTLEKFNLQLVHL